MSFLGKILVVFVLAATLVFMCFSVAVFTSHTKWRAKHAEVVKLLEAAEAKARTAEAETEKERRLRTEEVAAITNKLKTATDSVTTLTAQLDATRTTEAQRQQEVATADKQVQLANEEKEARVAEAKILREQNQTLLNSRNMLSNDFNNQKEVLKGKEIDLTNAIAKNQELNRRNGQLMQILAVNKISVESVADSSVPPPPVDGTVLNTLPSRTTGGNDMVEISLGGDDRLKMGHRLSVFRSGAKSGATPRYLGKIQLIKLYPDKAVGIVVERAGQTAIQKGDNVTTKL